MTIAGSPTQSGGPNGAPVECNGRVNNRRPRDGIRPANSKRFGKRADRHRSHGGLTRFRASGHAEACPSESGDPINLASVYWLERCRREGTSYTSESHFNIHNALTALNVHGAANTYAGITPPMKTAAKVRSRFRFRSHNHVGFQPGTEVRPDTGRLET